MYPRTNYEMTEQDLQTILDACKPTVCIKIGNYTGGSPQENANRAWQALGKKMGFDYETVQPIPGAGERFFSAVPTETAKAKAEREKRELEEQKKAHIESLRLEIEFKQKELNSLLQPDGPGKL